MKYMGSKARWATQILPHILDARDERLYVEPFLGGANTFHLVGGPKWGNDANADVIAMFSAIAAGWNPPENVSEEDYREARLGNVPPHVRGFIGIGCSYAGKFFGGYARGNDSKGRPRNYAAESRANALRQAVGIVGARLTAVPYWEMDIPSGSIVYCDPPYANATKYATLDFDHAKFWEWCADLSMACRVFVSEYAAPPEWRCVWSALGYSSLTQDTGAKRATERLFTRGPD